MKVEGGMKVNPYKARLQELVGARNEITVERDGATNVIGTVLDAEEDGCSIASKGYKESEYRPVTFIAYKDIRGIVELQVDPEML